jgi:hypothetical protein
MDGSDCHAAAALLAAQVQIFLVAVELGGPFAHEPVHLSRPVGLAEPTLWDCCAKSSSTPPGGFNAWLIRTAERGSGFTMTENPSKYDGKSMVNSLNPG